MPQGTGPCACAQGCCLRGQEAQWRGAAGHGKVIGPHFSDERTDSRQLRGQTTPRPRSRGRGQLEHLGTGDQVNVGSSPDAFTVRWPHHPACLSEKCRTSRPEGPLWSTGRARPELPRPRSDRLRQRSAAVGKCLTSWYLSNGRWGSSPLPGVTQGPRCPVAISHDSHCEKNDESNNGAPTGARSQAGTAQGRAGVG